jgi:phosphoenolpyruvate synthase/pyruvate phosphate dikinase
LNDSVDRFIKSKIRGWQPSWSAEKINDFLTSISFLERNFPFQDEMEEIVLLNKTDVNELYKKYAWFNMYVWDGRPFTKEKYISRMKNFLSKKEEVKKEMGERNRKVKEAKNIIRQVSNSELRELLIITQDLIYLKTERMDIFPICWCNILHLVGEICKRIGISYENLLSLTFKEIIGCLQGEPVPNDLEKRYPYAIVRLDDESFYFYGDAYEETEKALEKDYSQLNELKGAKVTKGVVRGTAKILQTDRELHKLEKGDILISNMTNPNYNIAFEKVAGVVTDEGGVLCHSAIMAREFNLPCVVGTKIATRVFKDGDLVEVDADKGIVRKI